MNLIESYQSNRIVDRLHAIAQFILVFLILAAVNAIAMRNYKRIDTTIGRDYTLSAQSVAYLSQLDRPIKVVVTLSDQDNDLGIRDIFYDVRSLLNEYEYETRNQGPNRIQVEYIDIYKHASKAKELGIDQEDSVIFLGNTKRPIPINKLYRIVNNELNEFIGESAFTSAILEVSQKEAPQVYFTSGHGELDPNNFTSAEGISRLKDELESRNIKINLPLNLASLSEVPKNASLVIVPAPKTRFLPQEQEKLKNYLRRSSGRLLLLLEPGYQHGLDDLLFEWGILTDNALVIEADPNYVINGGDLMVRRFAEHAITDELLKMPLSIITDRARVVREDPGRPIDDSLIVTELMETSISSWGEKSYANQKATPSFDPTIDLKGPIRIGAISERKVDSSLGISIPGGRLIVIGTSNFITNNRIQASGNLFLILNAINYSIDRVAHLNIPPRPIRKVKLDLSIEQLLLSRYLIWLGPPLVVGFFGLIVYLARRQ